MKRDNYTSPLEKLLTPTILLSVGLIIYRVTGFTNIFSYIKNHQYYFILGLILFISALYLYIVLILDNIVKSKEDILYLKKIKDNICYFIDIKCNIYKYKNRDYKESKFYSVYRTYSYIEKVKGETNAKFHLKEYNDTFISVMYIPFIKRVNLYILPFMYILLIIGLILGSIYNIFIIHLINSLLIMLLLFDIYNKIKKEEYLVNKFRNMIMSILLSVIIIFIVISIFNSKYISNTLILLSILSVSILILLSLIYSLKGKRKLENMYRRIYIFLILIYLIIYLFYLLIYSIINNAFPLVILSSFLITISGYTLYKDYFKNN